MSSKFIKVDQDRHAAPLNSFTPLINASVAQALRELEHRTLPVTARYLRTDAAARFLSLEPATLADWRGEVGRGPKFRKVGGRVVYAVEDLVAWMEQHPLECGGHAHAV
ncbi:MAG: helix-turn-helix transcriptional regulator [Minisyncoccia bacterium]